MAIYELNENGIRKVGETNLTREGIREREDLQRILRDNIEAVCPSTMIIAEEFGQWEESSRRIDLLGLDKNANLIIIELKRTEDGGHMELQAIRYAAMVSTMTFEQVVEAHSAYLLARKIEEDPQGRILRFLGWPEVDNQKFAQDVRICLVSADFSKELTTAVMWLNDRDIDIRCVRLKAYKLDDRLLLDVQQVIPLPEASEYQIQVKKKEQIERATKGEKWDAEKFIKKLTENKGIEFAEVAADLLEWSKTWADDIWWGQGSLSGSFLPCIDKGPTWYPFFSAWTYGGLEIQFKVLSNRPIFSEEAMRLKLLEKLKKIPGVELEKDYITGFPKISFDVLKNPAAMKIFKETILWAVDVIKAGKNV